MLSRCHKSHLPRTSSGQLTLFGEKYIFETQRNETFQGHACPLELSYTANSVASWFFLANQYLRERTSSDWEALNFHTANELPSGSLNLRRKVFPVTGRCHLAQKTLTSNKKEKGIFYYCTASADYYYRIQQHNSTAHRFQQRILSLDRDKAEDYASSAAWTL